MTITPTVAEEAARYLTAADPLLAPVIRAVGPCTIKPHQDYYAALVRSILGQQLSLKAAASIERRFIAHFGGQFPSPEALLLASSEELRACGLSGSKTNYIRDVAHHVNDGRIEFDRFDQLDNETIIRELTAIKGVGEWTVHMFLMFCMARSDILAIGDLGIKNGVQRLYGLNRQPSAADITEIASHNKWHPYETVACWYVWRSLELADY